MQKVFLQSTRLQHIDLLKLANIYNITRMLSYICTMSFREFSAEIVVVVLLTA